MTRLRLVAVSAVAAAALLRCATFGSSDAPPAGGAPDGAEAAGPDGDAGVPLPSARRTFSCPGSANPCTFVEQVCCVQHTDSPFSNSDSPTGTCLEAGTPCLTLAEAGQVVTIAKCDGPDLCREILDAASAACCNSAGEVSPYGTCH